MRSIAVPGRRRGRVDVRSIPHEPMPTEASHGIGVAIAPAHHGEILQGAFLDDEARLCRGLLTMPCDLYTTRAVFAPSSDQAVHVHPASRIKARRAARATLAALGRPRAGGYLVLTSRVPTCHGYGSSTSDVLAAILAVQDAFGQSLPEAQVARIAVAAETASDPLMFAGRTVLFAQREGRVIEEFGSPLPRLAVLGFMTSDTGVDTLALPPAAYGERELDEFRELRELTRAALAASDPGLLGAVATASTAINQRYLPMERYELIQPLIRHTGAVGLQTAHSGDVAGLMFDSADPGSTERQAHARTLLYEIGITDTWSFAVGGVV